MNRRNVPALQPEPVFDGRAVPLALGGVAVTVVVCRVVSTVALHVLNASLAFYVALFYVMVFGGLWFTCLMVSRRYGSGRPIVDFGFRWRPLDLARGLLVVVIAQIAQGLAMLPWANHIERLQRLTEGYEHVSLLTFLEFALAAVVLAPFLEELVFRGMVQRSVAGRVGQGWAVVVQGVAFGLYHATPGLGGDNLPYVAGLTAVGLVFGLAARRTRTLGTTASAHCYKNLLGIVILAANR